MAFKQDSQEESFPVYGWNSVAPLTFAKVRPPQTRRGDELEELSCHMVVGVGGGRWEISENVLMKVWKSV